MDVIALQQAADPRAAARHALRRSLLRIAALVAVLGAKYVVCHTDELDCRTAARELSTGIATTVCQAEYTHTGAPAAGALLAELQRRSGNAPAAAALANELLATAARGDALLVLARLAIGDRRFGAAITMLERARPLHAALHQFAQLAVDDQTLAGVFTRQNQFAEALRALDACITESQAARDATIEGYCHLSAGQALWRLGHFEAARGEIERARPLLDRDRDVAALEHALGDLEQEIARSPLHTAHNATAVEHFERALGLAARAKLPGEALSAELNLAYSFAQIGRPDEAARHLDAAAAIDHDDRSAPDRALLEAQIAHARGDDARAAALADSLHSAAQLDDDSRLHVCEMAARIALAAGDLGRAETWASRGVEIAEAIRGAQVLELRPWALSSRRESYELLFAALARSGRLEDALLVFDRLHGRTLLDAMGRTSARRAGDLRAVAVHTEELRALLPTLSTAPLAATGDRGAIREALRRADLLALVVAAGDVWSVTAHAGQLAIDRLGSLAALRPRFQQLGATPGDRALAEELGALLVPGALWRETPIALRVILDGPLSTLPVAALRRAGRPLIAARPIVRAPRLSQLACVPAMAARRAVVLADARGDLPAARAEAEELARSQGSAPALGEGATTAALFSAGPGDALHVGVHADVGDGGGYLDLHDRRISALEIAARGLGPARVVLAACVSAIADDVELATSLPTAFLAGGSRQVVATLHPVGDGGAREVIDLFYARGGLRDPVRALADAQAVLAQRDGETDWASFAVFGYAICGDQGDLQD